MAINILLLILTVQPLVWCLHTKKGLAHAPQDFKCNDFKKFKNLGWWHDWSCDTERFYNASELLQCTSDIDDVRDIHVPMIWTFNSKTNYTCHHGSSLNVVMGPNEPNHLKQANKLASEIAANWHLMEDNATEKILVSPSAANCKAGCNEDGNTTEWFTKFFELCQDCRVDEIATHTYWCSADKVMNHLEDLYNLFNRKIWLSEFACRNDKNNATRVLEFVKEILPRLDAAHFVSRYSWFKARINNDKKWVQTSASLFEPNGTTLTPVGEVYANFNATEINTDRK